MTKSEALKFADGSVNKLARLLGISHVAVSKWDEKQIPLLREYQLKEIAEKQQSQQQLEPA